MGASIYICLAVLTSTIVGSSATSQCGVSEITACHYTVLCKYFAGNAWNPPCESNVYVTFIIAESNKEILTTGFFSSTNFDSRVREIRAKNCTWTQIGTSAFRYFPRTLHIDLSGSHIHYIDKEAFRNLNALLTLNLSRNEIETLYSESLFISDTRLNNLNSLDLSYNALTELSGDVLSQTPNLISLDLQHNNLTAIADDAFNNLKYLSMLNLRSNRLTALNMTLVHLKSLTYLDISLNLIIKLSSYEINRLVALINFNASNNAIDNIDSNSFNQSVYLKVIDLSYNKIQTNITNDTFSQNVELNYIDLSHNLIPHIERNSFIQANLSYLNLENNCLNGEIEENTFSGLRDLKNINLYSQNISAINSLAFANMDNLTYLNVTNNSIIHIDETSFVNNSLNILDLSFNYISDLSFIKGNLIHLTELYLNNNNLTTVEQNTFRDQTMLIKLDISMNMIVIIEEFSLPLSNLQYLSLSGNKLQGSIKKNMFSPSKFLRFLDLSNFNITNIEEMAFVDLPVLTRLNLSYNAIESIHPNNFERVDNMFSLDISHNLLSQLSNKSGIMSKNLQALYLNNNNFIDIKTICSNSSKLAYLDLSYNNIIDVSCIGADMFPILTTLDLTQNRIKTFNNPKTNSLHSLIDLKLAYNELEHVDLSHYKDLKIIELGYNNIVYLNNSFFNNIYDLQALDVSNNKIAELLPGTFKDMTNLKLVNVSSNNLSSLRYGSLKGLHKTEKLDFSRNNITFIDVDIFHECTELNTLIIDYNRIKTLDVERLVTVANKLKILSIGGNPISCKEVVHNVNSKNNALVSVVVTSIDKIYHEDNVHGIQCGDGYSTTTVKPEFKTDVNNALSSLVYTIIGIGLILVLGMGGIYWYRRQTMYHINLGRSSRIQLHNSVELDNSEFQGDLLN